MAPIGFDGFQTSTTYGLLQQDEALRITSERNAGGVVFGDSIEEDRLEFLWGTIATVVISTEWLELVRAGGRARRAFDSNVCLLQYSLN